MNSSTHRCAPVALGPGRPRVVSAAAFLLALGALGPLPGNAADPPPFAQLNVTVNPQDGGRRVPTPFTVLPDETRAALYVPDTGGVLLLRGDTILHHFPIPNVPADGSAALDDLEASDRMLVGGKWTPGEAITVELHIFDLQTGRSLAHVESRNPHLGGDANDRARFLWRVVVDGDTVGVYDPRLAASVPLWVAGSGAVESADQIARMRAGIGFGRPSTWAPAADGALALRFDGRGLAAPSADRAPPGNPSIFLDDAGEPSAAPAADRATARLQSPLARFVALVEPNNVAGSAPTEWSIDAARAKLVTVSIPCLQSAGAANSGTAGAAGAPDSCLVEGIRRGIVLHEAELTMAGGWIRGRPVRVRGGHVYWPFLRGDELEIRRQPIDWLPIPPLGP